MASDSGRFTKENLLPAVGMAIGILIGMPMGVIGGVLGAFGGWGVGYVIAFTMTESGDPSESTEELEQ